MLWNIIALSYLYIPTYIIMSSNTFFEFFSSGLNGSEGNLRNYWLAKRKQQQNETKMVWQTTLTTTAILLPKSENFCNFFLFLGWPTRVDFYNLGKSEIWRNLFLLPPRNFSKFFRNTFRWKFGRSLQYFLGNFLRKLGA